MAMEEIRMARMSKEEQARREGMAYALRFAREKGLDALEADLKMRNAIDLPLRVSKADLDKFSDNVKYNTVLYVKILMAVTMHDEFGFGNKRIKQMFESSTTRLNALQRITAHGKSR